MYGFDCTTVNDVRFAFALAVLALKSQRTCEKKETYRDYSILLSIAFYRRAYRRVAFQFLLFRMGKTRFQLDWGLSYMPVSAG